MGVIERQGFKSAIVTYFFMTFGVVSNLLIYTKMLEVAELGTIAFVVTTGITFAPFIALGFPIMYLKFFARFEKDEKSLSRLYSLTMYGPIILSIVVCLTYFFFRDSIIEYYTVNRDITPLAVDLAVLLTTLFPFLSALTYVCSTLQRTAMPSLMNNIIKVFQPLCVILYYYKFISFDSVLILISLFFFILLVAFYMYQQSQRKILFSLDVKDTIKLPKVKNMISYALYGFAIGVGGMLITNIDGFMVASLLGMKDMGLYNWGLTIIAAVIIPFGMIGNISAPFVSKYWEENNMVELNKLYKQSANVLLLVCLALLYAVWLGLDDLFTLLPKGDQYKAAKYTIILLGVAKVLDVATGLNDQIIAFSTRHRSFFWIIGFTAVLNILLNFYLIPKYGINGAAFATLVSFIIFNFVKYFFIKLNFKLSPFNINYAYIFMLATGLFVLFYFLPEIKLPFWNMMFKSGGFLVIYAPLMYLLKLSKEYNSLIDKLLISLKFR